MSQELSLSKFFIQDDSTSHQAVCDDFDWQSAADLSFITYDELIPLANSSPLQPSSRVYQQQVEEAASRQQSEMIQKSSMESKRDPHNVSCHSACSCLKGIEWDPSNSLIEQTGGQSSMHTPNVSWVPESVGVFSAQALEDAFANLDATPSSFYMPYNRARSPPAVHTIKYLRRRNASLKKSLRRHQSSLKELRLTLKETNVVITRIFKLMNIYVKGMKY
jgi:hypothetical protein